MRLKNTFTRIILVVIFFLKSVAFANASENILDSCEHYLEHRHEDTLASVKSETTCKVYFRAIAELITASCSINDPNLILVRFKNKDLITPIIEELDGLIYAYVLQFSMFNYSNIEKVPEAAQVMAFISGASDKCPN